MLLKTIRSNCAVSVTKIPKPKNFGLIDQQHGLAALDHCRFVQKPLASRVVFQMDQAVLGNSENEFKTKIWCAMSTYVLIAIVEKALHLNASRSSHCYKFCRSRFSRKLRFQAPCSSIETLTTAQTLLVVASRMIIRTFYKQMSMRSVPVFHGPHWGFALERRLG